MPTDQMLESVLILSLENLFLSQLQHKFSAGQILF